MDLNETGNHNKKSNHEKRGRDLVSKNHSNSKDRTMTKKEKSQYQLSLYTSILHSKWHNEKEKLR